MYVTLHGQNDDFDHLWPMFTPLSLGCTQIDVCDGSMYGNTPLSTKYFKPWRFHWEPWPSKNSMMGFLFFPWWSGKWFTKWTHQSKNSLVSYCHLYYDIHRNQMDSLNCIIFISNITVSIQRCKSIGEFGINIHFFILPIKSSNNSFIL